MKKERRSIFMDDYLKGLAAFNAALTLPFKDERLLKEIFTHSSFLNEAGGRAGGPVGATPCSNERLEFLGDSVLDAAISHIIFKKYPQIHEGGLTRLRARLVNGRVLSGLARQLGLHDYILMGRGMARGDGAKNERVLAGLFEAYLGARYLEEGFEWFLLYVERLFSDLIEDAVREPGYFDYKPALQELAQRLTKSAPLYVVTDSSGSPHDRTFIVQVSIDGRPCGRGSGKSKKKAEQAAAKSALERLREEAKKS